MWVRSAHANVIRHANVTVQRKAMFRANAPNSIFFSRISPYSRLIIVFFYKFYKLRKNNSYFHTILDILTMIYKFSDSTRKKEGKTCLQLFYIIMNINVLAFLFI